MTLALIGRKLYCFISHYNNYICCSLRDTLYIHLENNELENLLPEGFQTKFPESVTVGQSVETWKTIVIYQHKHEQKTVSNSCFSIV